MESLNSEQLWEGDRGPDQCYNTVAKSSSNIISSSSTSDIKIDNKSANSNTVADHGFASKLFRSPLAVLSSSEINSRRSNNSITRSSSSSDHNSNSSQSKVTCNQLNQSTIASNGDNSSISNISSGSNQLKPPQPFIFAYKFNDSTAVPAETIKINNNNNNNNNSNSSSSSSFNSNSNSSGNSHNSNNNNNRHSNNDFSNRLKHASTSLSTNSDPINVVYHQSPQKPSMSPNSKPMASPNTKSQQQRQNPSGSGSSNSNKQPSSTSASSSTNVFAFQMKLKDIEIAHLKKENAFLKLRLMNSSKSDANSEGAATVTPKRRKTPSKYSTQDKDYEPYIYGDSNKDDAKSSGKKTFHRDESDTNFDQNSQYQSPKPNKSASSENQFGAMNSSQMPFPNLANSSNSNSSSGISNTQVEGNKETSEKEMSPKELSETLKSMQKSLNYIALDINSRKTTAAAENIDSNISNNSLDNDYTCEADIHFDDKQQQHPNTNPDIAATPTATSSTSSSSSSSSSLRKKSLEDRIADARQGSINLLFREYTKLTPTNSRKTVQDPSPSLANESNRRGAAFSPDSSTDSADPKCNISSNFFSPVGVAESLSRADRRYQSPSAKTPSTMNSLGSSHNVFSIGNVVDSNGHPVVPLINLPQVQSKLSEWKAKYKLAS